MELWNSNGRGCSLGIGRGGPPCVECGEGALALDAVTFFLVADLAALFFRHRLPQGKGDVGGLEVLGIGVSDVVDEGAERGAARDGDGLPAVRERCGVESREQASGDG